MPMSPAFRFGVVGSGRRTQLFLRLARMAPEHFSVAGVVTRSTGRGQQVESAWGVPTFRRISDLEAAAHPDFLVSSVPWSVMPETTAEAVGLGLRVLCETPPAPTAESLRELWATVGATGRVQVAEQYLLMPGHAARLSLVRRGVIGDVTSVQVSSTHMYHAVSMIRRLVGAGFASATVTARSFTAPLVNPLSPDGWSGVAETEQMQTTLALLDFGSGRSGLYDFTDNQWWNPLRARRIVIRGSRGEITDDNVVRLVDPTSPVQSQLMRRQLGIDLNLEGVDLDHISFDGQVIYRNPFPGARFSDDDLAVASILGDTGRWARDEAPPPYPLAEASQDHLLALAIEESARTGTQVTTGQEQWAS